MTIYNSCSNSLSPFAYLGHMAKVDFQNENLNK